MSDPQADDRRSLVVLVAILGAVVALGLVAGAVALWSVFGARRAAVEELEAARAAEATARRAAAEVAGQRDRSTVWILVDGLRADVLGDPDDPFPLLREVAERGMGFSDRTIGSTGTAGSVACYLTSSPVWSHGLLSPRRPGFHRVSEDAKSVADVAKGGGLHTSAFASAASLKASWTHLDRSFDTWSAPGVDRDFRLVLEEAYLTLDARGTRFDEFVLLQLDLGDEPDPGRLLALVRARRERFGEQRSVLDEVLEGAAESDEARAEDLTRRIGRLRGTEGWRAWREARYDALLGELQDGLTRVLGLWDERPDLLVAGTRGRLVTEPRPEPEVEGFSPALLRVPVAGDPASLVAAHAGGGEEAWTYSPRTRRIRSTTDPTQDHSDPITVGLETDGGVSVELSAKTFDRLQRMDVSRWDQGGFDAFFVDDPHVLLRCKVSPWSDDLLEGFAHAWRDTRALGDSTFPWLADPLGEAWPEGEAWSVDVTRDRRVWAITLAPEVASRAVVHLMAYPWTDGDELIVLDGAEQLLPAMPGCAIFELHPGNQVRFDLPPGRQPAVRVATGDGVGRTLPLARVRFEGRRFVGADATYLVPPWWPSRPDWYVPGLTLSAARDAADFVHRLVLVRPYDAPSFEGPLGLTPDDVAALRRLPDDA